MSRTVELHPPICDHCGGSIEEEVEMVTVRVIEDVNEFVGYESHDYALEQGGSSTYRRRTPSRSSPAVSSSTRPKGPTTNPSLPARPSRSSPARTDLGAVRHVPRLIHGV